MPRKIPTLMPPAPPAPGGRLGHGGLGAALRLVTLTLLLWNGTAAALSSDRRQPIDIEADGVELNEAKAQSTYTGRVEIRQGSMHLWADRVLVRHRARRPQHFLATGKPVRFEQQLDDGGLVKARARRMEYDISSEEIVLQGQAVLEQGKDRFASDRIVYDRKRGLVKAGARAKGRQRVHISIDPDR